RISVGNACGEIIEHNIEVQWEKTTSYYGEGGPKRLSFIEHCGNLDTWWRIRKDKSLAELQLESIEWVMKQKMPQYFKAEKEWQSSLAEVKKMASQIRSTRKPIIVNHRVFFFSK